MSPKNSEDIPEEFRLLPRAGVRGKYYERYTQAAPTKIVFAEGAPFLAAVTSTGLRTAGITRTDLSPITARIKFGYGNMPTPAHAR